MQPFVYEALPARVIFGVGTLAQASEEVARLGAARALVLSTPDQAAAGMELLEQLGGLGAGCFAEAAMHTPVEVTQRAMEAARRVGADAVVSLGGGSTIGLGKAIALRTDLPQIAIPTTYAGSEATPILGETEAGVKTTQRTLKVLPETILYDVDLTLTLPPALSAVSGLNAIAHAVEALYARDGNPIISALAEQGVKALAVALPIVVNAPHNIEARSQALFGAWACGVCLGSVGMSLHHKLCHTLGGSFGLPHAETHAVVLPHAAGFNAAAAPGAMAALSRALGEPDPVRGLARLASEIGAPTSLASLGLREVDLDRAADLASANPYLNPRPIERDGIRRLLQNAWSGASPSTR